jgi:signal transduction histidine kinase
MRRLEALARRYGLDLLVVAAAVESAPEVALRGGDRAPETSAWFGSPAVGAAILLLLARRRAPFAVPAAFWLGGAALSFADGRLVVFPTGLFVAGMGGAVLLGNLPDARQERAGLAVVLAASAIVAANDPSHSPGELVFIPALFAIGWLLGFALRERSAQADAAEERAVQAEREREAAARVAAAEERARIARELHDIVAHTVSVMVLQVGAVRHRLPEAHADDATALRGVEQTGRAALGEMRRLLGALRREGEQLELAPRPGLARLETLVEEVGLAGLPVRLHVAGTPVAVPPALDLSAYRIVQEGLTNALKHAHASAADVTVRYATDELEIEVRDDGVGVAGGNGAGYGLVGIRERVRIYGGEMTAGAAEGGGFALRARLPLGGAP